jgi:CRISPR/Cas system-associated protein endoribonuclease Cas2
MLIAKHTNFIKHYFSGQQKQQKRILSTTNENYICLFVLLLISVVYRFCRPTSQISKLIKKYRNFLLLSMLTLLLLYIYVYIVDSFKSRTKTCCKIKRNEKFKCNWRNHIVLKKKKFPLFYATV